MTSAILDSTRTAKKLDCNHAAATTFANSPLCAADYLRLTLASKVYEAIQPTPLERAEGLSWRLQCNVLLKREDTLSIGSYKIRGVYNMIAHVPERERWRGVIAYSRGNHGLAVAFAARKLRIPSLIVLPLDTPESVCQRLSQLLSTVILHGSDIQAAERECSRLQELHGLVHVPAGDNALVIAGHGTIGPEILEQADLSRLEAIICPVSSGSLVAGLGKYVKRIAPHVKIVAVERTKDNNLSRSICHRNKPLPDDKKNWSGFSKDTVEICAEVVDEIVLVGDQAISAATKEAFDDTQRILQPQGAITIAGLKQWAVSNGLVGSNIDVVVVTSEANVDFFTIPSIVARAAILEQEVPVNGL